MSHHGFLGAEGRCFSFDHRAEGYARGEGVGSIILKPLSSAINDGDTIRAVIRGTGVNQDGRTPGISLPSVTAQESLIRDVYQTTGLDFNDTMFVEAHGTGTSAGDPIETEAIARAFSSRRKDIPLYVGAIKTGIGHLEGGSGVASIIKSVLMLENAIIPPNVNFEKVNPKIPIERWNIEFPLENIPWPTTGLRRISVNSFGVGGTNAHCILDDAYHYLEARGLSAAHNTVAVVPTKENVDHIAQSSKKPGEEATSNGNSAQENGNSPNAEHLRNRNGNGISSHELNGMNGGHVEEHPVSPSIPTMFLLSAFDEDGIQRNASAIAGYLDNSRKTASKTMLQDLAFTLSNKRSSFPWKSYALATSVKELASKLSAGDISQPVRARNAPKIGFVFTGQGAQHWAMGRGFMVYPVFRKSLEDATEFMKALGSPWSLMGISLLTPGDIKC
jgi:acyl transferase domain-containing protein